MEKIKNKYSEDSIRVGSCREKEDLMNCTGGCNEYKTGMGCARCSANDPVSITIACAGQSDVHSSCGIKGI